MSAETSHLWSTPQRDAFRSLVNIGNTFFETDFAGLAIRPRLVPLVIAESGAGKSHVIREASRALGRPYCRVTSSCWVPGGVKDVQPTLLRIHEWLNENEQGVLHVDELDKLKTGFTDFYSQAIFGEMLDLLDRSPSQPIRNLEWTPDILQRLQNDVLVIGSGTWQQLWTDGFKPRVGFGENEDGDTVVASVRRLVATTDQVPQELLRRFSQTLIVMGPATEEDYRVSAESLGLSKLASELQVSLDFRAAARSRVGARWLEESMGRLLVQAHRENRTDLFRFRAFVPENSPQPEDDDEFGLDGPVL